MTKKTKITLLVLFVGLTTFLIAQSPDTLWTRTYGGASHDVGKAIRICSDSGYIICGATSSFGSGGWDVYLVRTDDKGDTLWTRTYGGFDNDEGGDVALTPDGGYIIAGYTCSFGAGGRDVYVVRVDSVGDTLWTRTYGGLSDDEANAIQPTPDGGYVICGTTYSFGTRLGDVYLLKMDSLSDTLWSCTYGGTSTDIGQDVVVLEDSSMLLCGSTWSYGAGGEDVYLIKTDRKGDTLWTRTHGGENREAGYDITTTMDGGFLVSGTSYFSLLGYEMFVFKTDEAGQVQWNYFNGSLGDDYAYANAEIPGRGYVFCGNFSFELFLIRADTAGNHYQYWIIGGAGTDCAYDLAIHPDGSYAVLGNTTSFGQGMTDIWLLRFGRDTLGVGETMQSPNAVPFLTIAPNPCRNRVHLRFTMPASINTMQDTRYMIHDKRNTALRIYDVSGRLVKDLSSDLGSCILDHESILLWNGTDNYGHSLPPGVYLVELTSGSTRLSEKVVFLR